MPAVISHSGRGVHPEKFDGLNIALLNNMPDSALEDTESQFFELLNRASGSHFLRIEVFSLPDIPRGDRARQHISSHYGKINALLSNHFDAAIITGTEPLHTDLKREPYWDILATVLDWAESNTHSTVLSCLAAHAGVLHSDGISRHRLRDKQFGVFNFTKASSHILTETMANESLMPHSRWNEVRAEDLSDCGYTILTESQQGGVDCFVKKKQKSLFVHFQGHPEYFTDTLLKEFRRDIRRFLGKERETYPTTPYGYFDAEATQLLMDFKNELSGNRSEDRLEKFGDLQIAGTLQNTWANSATTLYRNWLNYLIATRSAKTSSFAVTQAAK